MKSERRSVPVALTIAGSDSGGGAGIQADLKTFAALGVHGTTAVVALTAQNSEKVDRIEEVGLEMVEKQITSVVSDIGVDAAKTGMLASRSVIKTVVSSLKKYSFPLVVDPVMVSKSGSRLLRDDAVDVLIKELIPLSTVVTPNLREAEVLTGVEVSSLESAREAAREIVERLGAGAAVVKGGHLRGRESKDVLYWEGKFIEISSHRVETKNTHGTGCVFSAAITAELAKGEGVERAVRAAKEFVSHAIEYSLPLGRGHGPVNPAAWTAVPAERERVLKNLTAGLRLLESSREVAELVPEVQMNLVMALPAFYARGVDGVAGVPGRIVRLGDRVKASSPPAFGASSHLASALLAAMKYDSGVRALANVKYTERVAEVARRLGYRVVFLDRKREPDDMKKKEGATLLWVVEEAVKKAGNVPDLIYDKGDVGKEAMVRVFGRDALDVAQKILGIAKEVSKKE